MAKVLERAQSAAVGAFAAFGLILFFHVGIFGKWPHFSDYGPLEWLFVGALAAINTVMAGGRDG